MKNFKEIAFPAIALFLICLIATALLSSTNLLTAARIDEVANKAAESARSSVCDKAKKFEEISVTVDSNAYTCYAGKDKKGKVVGYAITTKDKSYGGDIEVMTGFDESGKITGIEILSIDDTPGLGMNAKKDGFKNEFSGKSGELTVSKTASADNEIQALTGATITSNAVTRCVNLASKICQAAREGKANG